MTEENKISGENSPQDQGAEWQNMDSPEDESLLSGMSDEDQARYEEWMSKRESGVEAEDFEGETNQTYKKEHGKYVYDEDGNHVMRERSESAFDLTPRLKGESNAHYGARLRYNKLLAQKAEEFPWSEDDKRYDDYGNRDRVKEQEDWRAKAGVPSFDEYFESMGGENGDVDSSEVAAEEEPTESYWHKIGKEGQRELVHKHPRKMGESNEEWAKRIEEEEGRKIFSADMGANVSGESNDSNGEEPTGETAENTSTVDTNSDAEIVNESTVNPDEVVDDATASVGGSEAASDTMANEGLNEVAGATEGTESAAESAAAGGEEDPAMQDSAESFETAERERLLEAVGTADFAAWLKEKGLTNGDVEGKSAEELQALIDERNKEIAENDNKEDGPLSAKVEYGDNGYKIIVDGKVVGDTAKKGGEKQPERSESQETQDAKEELLETIQRHNRAKWLAEKGLSRDDLRGLSLAGLEKLNKSFLSSHPIAEKAESGTPFSELISGVESRLDKAFGYGEISKAWGEISELIDNANDVVRAHVEQFRDDIEISSMQGKLSDLRADLRRLPRFTFPGTESRRQKDALKKNIAFEQRRLEEREMLWQERDESLPEITSEEDLRSIEGILHLDARVKMLHEQSNIRELDSRSHYYESKGYHETSAADMRSASSVQRGIWARNRQDYLAMRKRVEDYQSEHPEFILNPAEGDTTPDIDPIAYDKNVNLAAVEVQDVDDSGLGEDLDESEESEQVSAAEQAKREYDAAQEDYNRFVAEALALRSADRSRETGDWIADVYRKKNREKMAAFRKYVLEDGLELVAEDQKDDWRSAVDDESFAIGAPTFSTTCDILRSVRSGDTESAHGTLESYQKSEKPYQFFELLRTIYKYGDEEVKKLAEEFGYTEQGQAA